MHSNMQVALASVNGENEKSVRAGVPFDTAEYRAFTTSKPCKAVGTKIVGEEKVLLRVFGTANRDERKYDPPMYVDVPGGIFVGVSDNFVP